MEKTTRRAKREQHLLVQASWLFYHEPGNWPLAFSAGSKEDGKTNDHFERQSDWIGSNDAGPCQEINDIRLYIHKCHVYRFTGTHHSRITKKKHRRARALEFAKYYLLSKLKICGECGDRHGSRAQVSKKNQKVQLLSLHLYTSARPRAWQTQDNTLSESAWTTVTPGLSGTLKIFGDAWSGGQARSQPHITGMTALEAPWSILIQSAAVRP
jgi:hypothetical protein